jgi:hypothetical protein
MENYFLPKILYLEAEIEIGKEKERIRVKKTNKIRVSSIKGIERYEIIEE